MPSRNTCWGGMAKTIMDDQGNMCQSAGAGLGIRINMLEENEIFCFHN